MIVAFEGFDGVGKTTTASLFAKRVGGVAAAKYVALHSAWSEGRLAVNAGTDVDERFRYFVQLNRAQLKQARRLEEDWGAVALDSSIYRTVATHRVLGSVAAAKFRINPPIKPDRVFLLALNDEVWHQRITARDGGLVYGSKWDELLYQKRDAVREAYQELGLIELDAAEAPEKIVDRVVTLTGV